MDWGLYVTGAGWSSVLPNYDHYPTRPHPQLYDFEWEEGRKLAEYAVVYLSRGKGDFESTTIGPIEIHEGCVLLLFPDQWHRYRPSPETGWDEYWVSFAGQQMDRLVDRGFFSPERAVMQLGVNADLADSFCRILDRMRNEAPGFPQIIASHVSEILATILAMMSEASTASFPDEFREIATVEDRLVADALKLIWMQSEGNLNVDDLAKQLPTTRRSLERRFRSAVGHTILEEIISCRLQRAQRLLRKTDTPITQVAMTAGFSSLNNMGQIFRRFLDTSPRAYRQKYRGE